MQRYYKFLEYTRILKIKCKFIYILRPKYLLFAQKCERIFEVGLSLTMSVSLKIQHYICKRARYFFFKICSSSICSVLCSALPMPSSDFLFSRIFTSKSHLENIVFCKSICICQKNVVTLQRKLKINNVPNLTHESRFIQQISMIKQHVMHETKNTGSLISH